MKSTAGTAIATTGHSRFVTGRPLKTLCLSVNPVHVLEDGFTPEGYVLPAALRILQLRMLIIHSLEVP
jgi:hypothetical protein